MHLQVDTKREITEAIQKIAVGPNRGRDLTREHAYKVMRAALAGDLDEVQLAVFLIALRMKRESIEEFHGLLDAIKEQTQTLDVPLDCVLSLAEPFDGYVRTTTMTPFIPAVLAACGSNVVMHGVASVGPKHGVTAQKVYNAAGCHLPTPMEVSADCLQRYGWCYLDQQTYNPALFQLADLRDRIVKRTALTTLERLAMPIKGRRNQLALAYVHKAYPQIYAQMAFNVGFDDVLLFKGVEGGLAPALNKPLRRFDLSASLVEEVDAGDIETLKEVVAEHSFVGSNRAAPSLVDNADPVSACLEAGLAVLSGEHGIARDSLCLAAANILLSQQHQTSLVTAVENVQACLDNGSALEKFKHVVEFSK